MAVPEPTQLEALLQLLPACTRCRAVRKRCDTLLPACANCTRAGLPCTFYECFSKEVLPREYISSMVDHLRSLEATRDHIAHRTSTNPASTRGGFLVRVQDSYQFMGKNAPIMAAVPVANMTSSENSFIYPSLPMPSPARIDQAMHQFLVNQYLDTIHELFPIFDDQGVFLLQLVRDNDNPSLGQTFLLKMVYSIACHCLPNNDNRLAYLSDALYNECMLQFETLMKDHGVVAIQAVLLLAIRSTFNATTGSIGQLVNFAHRLEIELSSRISPEMTPILRRLQCTIYCLAGLLGGALDRPYDVAEPTAAVSSTTEQAQLLCAVYTWQSRHGAGGTSTNSIIDTILSRLDKRRLSPMLLAAVRQTQLLTQPSMHSARQLLEAYNDHQMVYNVFTSHWVYRATSYLIRHSDGNSATEGFIVAAKILERCTAKWPNSRVLIGALDDLRRTRPINSGF